jgi:cellulose synthase/poly-beta-1,6-N-acetylglucosamine synthase-like glycosyltransferase
MSFSGGPGLVLLLADLVLLLVVVCRPLRRRERSDDEGDGVSEVRMPTLPRSISPWRTAAFYLIAAILSTAYLALRFPHLDTVYAHVVGGLANLVAQNPHAIAQYLPHITATPAVLFGACVVAFACTVRATPGRRLAILLNALLYLALTVTFDSLVIALAVSTGQPLTPSSLGGGFVHIILAYLVFARMVFTTFSLPMPTRLPATRPFYWRDTVLWWSALVSSVALIGIGWMFLAQQYRFSSDVLILGTFILLAGCWPLLNLILLFVRWLGPKPVSALTEPIPINVIVAAYNERDRILPCLQSIDRAAARYGGSVHVIVCNDGSTDDTIDVIEKALGAFEHATGQIVHRPNGGIARAYNTAFALCTRDVVIRVDGDVVIHQDAFRYSVPWLLADPRVGQVAGMSLPRPGQRNFFASMRGFECLLGFGYARCAGEVVDTILNIQGPYACMRREVIADMHGWTAGMNGEDLDMTMKVTRTGYRIMHDLRVITYEDVPPTLGEFRAQRNRWSRAGIHAYARFNPFSSGLLGPRSWYQFTRLFSTRMVAMLLPLVILHGVELAVFDPTVRRTMLIFAALYVGRWVVSFVQLLVLAIIWGVKRYLLLFPFWYAFLLFRKVLILEGLLSLPTRPVSPGYVFSRRPILGRAGFRNRWRWQPIPIAALTSRDSATR